MIALVAAVTATCFAAARPLPPATPVTQADVVPADCTAGDRGAVRFDPASRAVLTDHAVAKGDYLGRLGPLPEAAVARGEPVVLRSRVGSVVIERAVTALQSARMGQRVFVRDADGRVFSVSLDLLEPQP